MKILQGFVKCLFCISPQDIDPSDEDRLTFSIMYKNLIRYVQELCNICAQTFNDMCKILKGNRKNIIVYL